MIYSGTEKIAHRHTFILLVPRQYPAVGVVGSTLFAGGGNNVDGVLSSFERYDLEKDAWTFASAITPTTAAGTGVVPRAGAAPLLFAVGGLAVFEGCTAPSNPCKPVRNVSQNAFTKRGWTAGSPLKTGRVYHGVAALDTPAGFALLAIGGSTDFDASKYAYALASVEMFVPS